MNRGLIRVNFLVSVWLLILFCAYDIGVNLLRAGQIGQAYGPFAWRVILWPAAVGSIELMLWFRPFRFHEHGSRVMAGFMAIMLALFALFVPMVAADLYDREFRSPDVLIILYVVLSHLAYSLFGD